jgi:phosphatidate cytidylyltransferase
MISSSLKLRLLSGLTLGPLALAIIMFGGLPFKIFMALAFGIAVREWINMARKGKHVVRDTILGVSYIGLCFLAFWKLRLDLEQGLFLTFCLCLGVVASDVSAYFSGKTIGGPKLAPAISPNKTWAGFIGGAIGSAAVLSALNYYAAPLGEMVNMQWQPFTTPVMAVVIGLCFSIVGQAGDLLISRYKRKVGVKDTGAIIPGHGGLLDRIDSVMLVTLFFLMAVMELGV